jgi:hypothetical protein
MNPNTKTAAVMGALLAIVTAAPANAAPPPLVDLSVRASARTRSMPTGSLT